jgi:alpha-L-fucosidase
MYEEGGGKYKFHVAHYGHPSKFGFKDVIHEWKAQNWNPDDLVALYKRAGAQYFFAMANHHDNFDLWDSKYHGWNSVRIGPQKDLIAGWAKAAREQGLKFGVSVHAAHAWMWYETAQGADKSGPLAGVAYDGKAHEGRRQGLWWDGLDPQELYAQNHPRSAPRNMHQQWDWGNGCSQPDLAYCQAFYNRTVNLINQYQPDLIYFDDTALPLWPVSDAGLKIAAHLYNFNMAHHGGKLEAVLFGKILDDQAAALPRVGHRTRSAGDVIAIRVADRHLHRRLALRPRMLRSQRLQIRDDRHPHARGHRQQEREPAAERPGARWTARSTRRNVPSSKASARGWT